MTVVSPGSSAMPITHLQLEPTRLDLLISSALLMSKPVLWSAEGFELTHWSSSTRNWAKPFLCYVFNRVSGLKVRTAGPGQPWDTARSPPPSKAAGEDIPGDEPDLPLSSQPPAPRTRGELWATSAPKWSQSLCPCTLFVSPPVTPHALKSPFKASSPFLSCLWRHRGVARPPGWWSGRLLVSVLCPSRGSFTANNAWQPLELLPGRAGARAPPRTERRRLPARHAPRGALGRAARGRPAPRPSGRRAAESRGPAHGNTLPKGTGVLF